MPVIPPVIAPDTEEDGMRKAALLGLAALMAATLASASPALAKDGDVIKAGPCSRNSDWKLKLSPENGRIEVDFEVDQDVAGDTWRVVLRHNGNVFFRGTRTTLAPSGSFEVHRVVNNLAGPDTITGRARNLRTDEVCRGSATF